MTEPDTEIIFEVQPLLQELNMQGSLFWVERVVVEADTNGSDITVIVDTDAGPLTVGTVNTSSRTYAEIDIERPAPVRALRLQDDFTDNVNVFAVELHMRPVEIGFNLFGGQRFTHTGKLVSPGTSLVFDIDPARAELDGTINVPLIEYLNLEINSGGTSVTPKIETEFGTIELESTSSTSRETTVYEIQQVGNVREVRLDGDWTSGIELYQVEVVVGSLELGIRVCEVN